MATAPDVQHPPSGKSKKSKKNRSHSVPSDHKTVNNAGMGGAVGGAPAPVPTRQLEFNQAMADFKTMFPSMDRDVIETVLRANNGAVDATIDQLLTLNADMPEAPQAPQQPQLPQYSDTVNNSFSSPPAGMVPVTPVSRGSIMLGDQPPPYSPPAPNSPFSQDMRARQLPPTPNQRGALPSAPQSTPSPVFSTTTMASPHQPEPRQPIGLAPAQPTIATTPLTRRNHPRWNPPLLGDLPADFLRVVSPGINRQRSRSQPMVSIKLQERMARNVQQQSSVDANDVEMQQMLEDERFALTLQNEEFLRELQHNPEFIAALDRDYNQANTAASGTPGTTHTPTTHTTTHSNQATPHQGAASPLPPGEGGTMAAGGVSTDDVEFRNKLTHMGKTTRFKFAQMAKKFNYRKKRSSSKPQLETAPASSTMNLLDDYDESGDSALLGTRAEVEENFYSDSHHKNPKKSHHRDLEEPIIFYQEDNEFALHLEI
ncbi:CUE domain-containing protein 1-like isoform X2 [Patiria miniata]|uniref:CUE domain-containing protein n=1 Tax=Patiria miniata TaxID=46514 RepID=A0A914BGT1_PATMI|nr:CUE domain-containing protein 1-like isoform X2 [Patiria miniata]